MCEPARQAIIAAIRHDLRHVDAIGIHAPLQQRRYQQPFAGADIQGAANAAGHDDLLGNAVQITARFADAFIRCPITFILGLVVSRHIHIFRWLYHEDLILKSTTPPKKYSSRFIETWKKAASSTQCSIRCDM
ncbi:hypothetical protein D3C77_293280 [compost metagenome]